MESLLIVLAVVVFIGLVCLAIKLIIMFPIPALTILGIAVPPIGIFLLVMYFSGYLSFIGKTDQDGIDFVIKGAKGRKRL